MKNRSLCFKYGSFSAALLALALGMASCHPEKKTGTDQSRAIKTEDITWEENPSAEGCKLTAAYPTDNSSAVTQNIREWMNEQLGGTYTGSLDDGKKLLEYYGTERAEQVKRDIAEIGENTAMDASAYYVQFKKAFETEKFITYTSEIYEYSGGAHGGESLSGGVFRKSDGRKFGWDMFTANGKEKLRSMIKNRLKKNFFKVNSDEELYERLLDENVRYTFPLPETDPVCRPNGVEFIYQQYEIAPYAAGIPTCTLPYDSLENLFTVTMKPMIESTTDSLALTYNPIVKR